MFRLNEAPEKALKAINKEKISRGCGMFWAVTCFLPSFGGSIGFCGSCKNSLCSCYPDSVSEETPITLNVLIDKLDQLRVDKSKISNASVDDVRKQIEWQVKRTIALLEKVTTEGNISGSYLERLKTTLVQIKTRASQEENLGLLVNAEKAPLLDDQCYVPNYGLRPKE